MRLDLDVGRRRTCECRRGAFVGARTLMSGEGLLVARNIRAKLAHHFADGERVARREVEFQVGKTNIGDLFLQGGGHVFDALQNVEFLRTAFLKFLVDLVQHVAINNFDTGFIVEFVQHFFKVINNFNTQTNFFGVVVDVVQKEEDMLILVHGNFEIAFVGDAGVL